MKRLFFISLSALLFLSGCKSKEGVSTNEECNSCEEAIVKDYGDPAVDGCGWVISINSEVYKPENLPAQYFVDGLKVGVKYQVKDLVNCGMVKDAFRGIYIEQIEKRSE